MLRPVKTATPELAFLVVVPVNTPLPGFVAISTVIEAVEVVMVFPRLSCTTILGGPARELPAVELPGCTIKASFAAAPPVVPVMLKLVLVSPVSPAADAVRV